MKHSPGSLAAYLPYLLRMAEYAVIPLIVMLGVARYFDRSKTRILHSILLLISLSFATASVVLAVSSAMYAKATGGFPYYDPLLLSIFRWGFVLSSGAIIFAFSTLRRPTILRWLALAYGVAMLLFWFGTAMGE
jgi:hypothetical protein